MLVYFILKIIYIILLLNLILVIVMQQVYFMYAFFKIRYRYEQLNFRK